MRTSGYFQRNPSTIVDKIRLIGMELFQLQFFGFGPFWTHEIKAKVKYKSISNILHLLSAPDPVPHA